MEASIIFFTFALHFFVNSRNIYRLIIVNITGVAAAQTEMFCLFGLNIAETNII